LKKWVYNIVLTGERDVSVEGVAKKGSKKPEHVEGTSKKMFGG